MKRLFLLSVMSLVLLLNLAANAQQFNNPDGVTYSYVNNGTVNTPQIDATNFVNNGLFNATTFPTPFETSHTMNWTNSGLMIADLGFRFRNNPSGAGVPKGSVNFFNGESGTIRVDGSFAIIDLLGLRTAPLGYFFVDATNIVNRGTFQVAPVGVMDMSGGNIDLAESLLEVPSLASTPSTSFSLNTNQYFPALGTYDIYWSSTNLAAGTRQINLNQLWTPPIATAPNVLQAPAPSQAPIFGFSVPGFGSPGLLADSETNTVNTTVVVLTNADLVTARFLLVPSNIVKQAVFVGLPPHITAKIGFADVGTDAKVAQVEFTLISTNRVTTLIETNRVFFQDTLGVAPATRLLLNVDANNPFFISFKPTNYTIDRLADLPTGIGPSGNAGVPPADFFTTSGIGSLLPNEIQSETVTNLIVTNGIYSAYGAFLDTVALRPPNVQGGTFTNLPGSIRIRSTGTLDLSDTRISAQGQIRVQSPNLLSSTNVVLDSDTLSFDVGSTNGQLIFEGVVPVTVGGRISGSINAWSGYWSNTITMILSNNFGASPISNAPPIVVPVSNQVQVVYHTLILDASGLVDSIPVYVYDLVTHAPHIELNDKMTVVQTMLLDGTSVAVNADLTVPGIFPINPVLGITAPGVPMENFDGTNAPTLAFFTNNAVFSIANTMHFGDDRTRYSTVVNSNQLLARAIQSDSIYFENRGQIRAGVIHQKFDVGLLTDGSSTATNDTQLIGGTLVLNNYKMTGAGPVELRINTVLTDGGVPSTITVSNGLSLTLKPAAGDLLASTVMDSSSKLTATTLNHFWGAEDRGGVNEGFINNGAIGKLVLNSIDPAVKFRFLPAGDQNALYVDLLQFDGKTGNFDLQGNATNVIINAGMKIYYADATVGGVSVAEKLNGKNNGRFVWVPTYAGTFSSVTNNGLLFNRALVQSCNIDSDGDGTVNCEDSDPIPPDQAFTPPSNLIGITIPQPLGQAAHTLAGAKGAKGAYNGLFYQAGGISPESSGSFKANVTARGQYSARVRLAGDTFGFSDRFDATGRSTNEVGNLTFELQLDLNGNGQIVGKVINSDEGWTADLFADRAASGRVIQKGKYTIAFPGVANDPGKPAGSGYGIVSVGSGGALTLKASLADDTDLSQSSVISEDGFWPLYSSLYDGAGCIIGWIQVTNGPNSDLQGQAIWIKPSGTGTDIYPDGFTFGVWVVGSRYAPPPNIVNGFATFSGGNLTTGVTNTFLLNRNFKATGQPPNDLSLKINKANGVFRGSFFDEELGADVPFAGVLLEKAQTGTGFFLGTDQSGEARLNPAP